MTNDGAHPEGSTSTCPVRCRDYRIVVLWYRRRVGVACRPLVDRLGTKRMIRSEMANEFAISG